MKAIVFFSILGIACNSGNNNSSDVNADTLSKNKSAELTKEKPRVNTNTVTESTNKPEDVALTFINAYVVNCNKNKEALSVKDWVEANKMTTPLFNKDLNKILEQAYKDDPEMGLEADPILDAQDYPEKGFELVSFDKPSLIVLLKGKDWPDYKLRVQMALLNGVWLVNGCGMVNMAGQ